MVTYYNDNSCVCQRIELGIELITTSVAVAKAHVERENRTFKNRLIAELRHEEITDIDKANQYLNEVFIPKMNRKFSYEINFKTSQMKTNNYSEQELNLIISERFIRIIDNASSIKYEGKYYIPVDPDTGEVVCFMKKTECNFIITYNAEYWCEIEKKYYKLIEIENRDTTMKKESTSKTHVCNFKKRKSNFKKRKSFLKCLFLKTTKKSFNIFSNKL